MAMMSIRFKIPGKPVGKARARTLKSGFSYTPETTVNYENLVKLCFQEKSHGSIYFEGPIYANIHICYEITKSTSKKNRERMLKRQLYPTKKPDIDNVQKIIFDALNGVAYKDDTQIVNVLITKTYGEQPFVEVVLGEMAVPL